jgi:hypothetical protein
MRENLLDVAQQIIEEAAFNAPQRTGRMKHLMHADGVMLGGTGLQIEFIGDAPYTVYMEEGFTSSGGRWIEGHHFIENAANHYRPQLVEAMSEAMAKSLKEVGITSERGETSNIQD